MMKEMLEHKVWAVVGATPKKEKFGYKVYQALKKHDYTVYAIHPTAESIDGEKCYRSLAELPEVPEVVNLIVPESVGLKTLESCRELGITRVWMQPGADTDAVLKRVDELSLNGVQGCVLVELNEV